MSGEKVPYITKIENQRDACIKALKAIETYHASLVRVANAAYKSDALKEANIAKATMVDAVNEAKKQLGGLYA